MGLSETNVRVKTRKNKNGEGFALYRKLGQNKGKKKGEWMEVVKMNKRRQKKDK
jgi:hypothetical protein